MTEALWATNNPCSIQYLHRHVRLLEKNPTNEPPFVTIFTNQEDKDILTLQTEASVSSGDSESSGDNGLKEGRKYVREKKIK